MLEIQNLAHLAQISSYRSETFVNRFSNLIYIQNPPQVLEFFFPNPGVPCIVPEKFEGSSVAFLKRVVPRRVMYALRQKTVLFFRPGDFKLNSDIH